MRTWKWIGHTLRKDQINRDLIGIHRESEGRVDQELPGREQSQQNYKSEMCLVERRNKWQKIESAGENL
jgi:hypothetical protein